MTASAPAGPRFAPLDRVDLMCPRDLDALLAARAEGRTLLAGGTDLLVEAVRAGGLRSPAAWVGGVPELHGVGTEGRWLRVRAASTLADVARSPEASAGAPAVVDGAAVVGSVQIRAVATLVGNVCNASPAADTVPGLAVHRARVELAGPHPRTRELALTEFLRGPGVTALEPEEVVTGLRMEALATGEGSSYRRFIVRRSMDLAFVGVAVRLALEAVGGPITSAAIALGAVGPTVAMAGAAAQALVGAPLGDVATMRAADLAAEACEPISDVRSSAGYRRHLVRALVRECLPEAHRRATRRLEVERS